MLDAVLSLTNTAPEFVPRVPPGRTDLDGGRVHPAYAWDIAGEVLDAPRDHAADIDTVNLNLGRSIEDLWRDDDLQNLDLTIENQGLFGSISVTLSREGNGRIRFQVSTTWDGDVRAAAFTAHLDDVGTIRGFDTRGAGRIDTIHAPQLTLNGGDGSRTDIDFGLSGVGNAVSAPDPVGLTSVLPLHAGRAAAYANTTEALSAYSRVEGLTATDFPGDAGGVGVIHG